MSGWLTRFNRTGATRVEAASHIIRKRTWDEAVESEKDLGEKDTVGGASTARYIHGGKRDLSVTLDEI